MLGLLTMALAAATPTSPPPEPIIVTGTRLEELRLDYQRCERSGCPIRDDVIASVRYADALFFRGEYEEARRTLARSVSRNRPRASQDARAMAELYVAQSNVAKHYGDNLRESVALQSSARVLGDNLPGDDQGLLIAELSVGDMFMRRGDVRYSEARYAGVASRAQASGKMVLARLAEIRSASALLRRGRVAQARSRLAKLAALPGDEMRVIRLASRVLEYRIARLLKDEAGTGRAIAGIASEPPSQPVLLWEPAMPSPTETLQGSLFIEPAIGEATSVALRWADIEFEIDPSGTIKNIEVVQGQGDPGWAAPILKTIRERLYTAVPTTPEAPVFTRKERYSLTASFEKPIGSNIPRRVANSRFERLDLTQPPPKVPVPIPGAVPVS